MGKKSILSHRWIRGSAVVAAAALSLAVATPAHAAPLTGVQSAKADKNVVTVTFNDNIQGKITLLEDGIFRYNIDPSGKFSEYATPRSKDHTAKIQAQPDTSDKYSKPNAKVEDKDGKYIISTADGKTTIELDKSTAKMTVKTGDTVVMQEASPVDLESSKTTQTLVKHDGENFFGGGVQNGRYIHTGNSINIKNESNWNDGGVSSPNPFYWSSDGYGVLRNTFADGVYDFGKTTSSETTAEHDEDEFDAYYFVADAASGKSTAPIARELLQEYYKVTGNPILMPEYGFYPSILNAYNRDAWSDTAQSGYSAWKRWGHAAAGSSDPDIVTYERGGTGNSAKAGDQLESLNGTGATVETDKMPEGVTTPFAFSARAWIEEYQSYDMPLGFFLPNDGYGTGYGQNGYNMTGGVNADGSSSEERLAALEANVKNLGDFSKFANEKGVEVGLWTQSDLEPTSDASTLWQNLRSFSRETTPTSEGGGGVTALKTDVAWVGPGYSFGLNGIKYAYDTASNNTNKRPDITTICGWAGTQRFGGLWTGDQTGGNWEYIRYHIPTFLGSSLSGNPNITSDMDGIYGGNPIIATRDYQWKSFTGAMLGMDGWGSYVKMPYAYGDPYTGINRMYLKLKSQLMPYIYTSAASAANIDTGNNDTGDPYVRAMFFSDDSALANSTATQYQFTLGEDILVAPIYQNTQDGDDSIGDGNDIRNNIYLPGTSDDIWIDYWTGDQYRGGQMLNNFDAPIWKLPVFIKANAILPMWEENNNPQAKTEENPGGVDRTHRIVEFYATTGSNSYTQYEDDGNYLENKIDDSNAEYGNESTISYGDHVSTKYDSAVSGEAGNQTATFTANASTGTYKGYDSNRDTTFVVNVSKEPSKIEAKNGDTALTIKKVDSKDAFDKATAEAGTAVVFYNADVNMNTNASNANEAVRNESFSSTKIAHSPKLYVKFAQTDVQKNAQILTLSGFENSVNLAGNELDASLKAPEFQSQDQWGIEPYKLTAKWNKVEGATGYDLKIDGTITSVGDTDSTVVSDLAASSKHTFQIRSHSTKGYSEWSQEITVTTAQDPWRNTPTPAKVTWDGDYYNGQTEDLAFDHLLNTNYFHSGGNDIGKSMTIDYGKVYDFQTFRYYPRTDAGNGTVTKMRIETSLDGNTWTSQEVDFERNGDEKTVDLKGTHARYIRLTPLASVGNFFSARELAFDIVDGTTGYVLGDYTGDGKVDSNDATGLKQGLGLENRAGNEGFFSAHVLGHNVDVNSNGIYDAYDISWTLSQIGGGTKQTGAVAGSLTVVPSQTEVKTGDKITVDVYANDVKNANVLGSVVHFDDQMFTYEQNSLTTSPYLGSMSDFSKAQTDFTDHKQAVNITVGNEGDGKLYNGSDAIASFTLVAKKDGKVDLSGYTWLVGPKQDVIQGTVGGDIDLPEIPSAQMGEYGQDAFNITVTNDALPTDDGSNVSKIIQGGKYDPLFDNVKYHDGSSGSGTFELKWSTNTDEVSVPLTLHFDFKNPSALDNVVLYNRQDQNGQVSGNGILKQVGAVVRFADGSKQEFTGGDYDKQAATWTFKISDENKGKKVAGVDVEVKQTSGAHLMTISEIDFNYVEDGSKIESVQLDENNAKSIYTGDLVPVNATIAPSGAYQYFTATSSDPSVVSISQTQTGDQVQTFARGNKPGKATITVASVADPTKTASYEIEVKEGVDVSGLRAAVAQGKNYAESAYTADTYKVLASAISAGEALLEKPVTEISKDDVADATVAIEKAIAGLEMRPVDDSKLINKDGEESKVTVSGVSSFAAESPATNIEDNDPNTFWHSSYDEGATLPQYVIFDLGGEYDLTDVTFLPRQDGGTNGDIFEAELYVADSEQELEQAKSGGTYLGTFTFDNDGKKLTNRDEYQQMAFGSTPARFVKMVITKAGGDQPNTYCSMADAKFYGTTHTEQTGVDKSKLQTLVSEIDDKNLNASDYTEASWTKFANALESAKTLLADNAATQDEIDGIYTSLNDAYKGLVKTDVPSIDNPTSDQLQGLVDQAGSIDTTGKTAQSVQALKDALAYAQKVLSNAASTPEEIKAAYDQLKLAIEGLQDAGTSTPPSDNNGATNGNTDTSGKQQGGTEGNLAQTGDVAAVAVGATGILGAVSAAVGGFFKRRRRSE